MPSSFPALPTAVFSSSLESRRHLHAVLQNPPDLTSFASHAVATGSMQVSINFLKLHFNSISQKTKTLLLVSYLGTCVTPQCGNLLPIPICTIWKSKGLSACETTIDQWKSMDKCFLPLSPGVFHKGLREAEHQSPNPLVQLGWPTLITVP